MDLSQLEITLDKLRKQGEFNDMIVSGFGDYRPRTPTEGFVSHCLPQHFVGWQTFTTFQGRQSGTEVTKMVRGDGRVTYTRRHAYHTKSNKVKVVKTPGGTLKAHYHKKSAKGPRCGDCGISLPGIKHLRPKEYKNLKKREKTVSRAYGGSRCAGCVRQRVIRAFLIEEQKIVKQVLLEKQKKKKA